MCYLDGISIPHIWYTIETYNNQLYIETTNSTSIINASIITLPSGNYTASSLATTLTSLLQTRLPEMCCSCNYNINVGTIEKTNSSDSEFIILTDETGVSLQGNSWYGIMVSKYTILTKIALALLTKFSETQFSYLRKHFSKVGLVMHYRFIIVIFILQILDIIVLLVAKAKARLLKQYQFQAVSIISY